MDLSNLSDEFKTKALNCKTTEELYELVQNEGIELTDEQLDAISGGLDWDCVYDDCTNYKSW